MQTTGERPGKQLIRDTGAQGFVTFDLTLSRAFTCNQGQGRYRADIHPYIRYSKALFINQLLLTVTSKVNNKTVDFKNSSRTILISNWTLIRVPRIGILSFPPRSEGIKPEVRLNRFVGSTTQGNPLRRCFFALFYYHFK